MLPTGCVGKSKGSFACSLPFLAALVCAVADVHRRVGPATAYALAGDGHCELRAGATLMCIGSPFLSSSSFFFFFLVFSLSFSFFFWVGGWDAGCLRCCAPGRRFLFFFFFFPPRRLAYALWAQVAYADAGIAPDSVVSYFC